MKRKRSPDHVQSQFEAFMRRTGQVKLVNTEKRYVTPAQSQHCKNVFSCKTMDCPLPAQYR
jgi:hypothetical protein